MNGSTITVVATVIACNVALGAIVAHGQHELRRDVAAMRRAVDSLRERVARLEAVLRERMARIEGLFEGLTRRDQRAD